MRFSLLRFLLLFLFVILTEKDLCSASSLSGKVVPKTQRAKDFFILTIPKSGTHLIAKLLAMITERNVYRMENELCRLPTLTNAQFEQAMHQCKARNQFPFYHPLALGQFFTHFLQSHPEYLPLFNIRDLRDVLVSMLYLKSSDIENEIGRSADLDERLAFLISKKSKWGIKLEENVRSAIIWINRPGVFVTRFEDIVGVQGGGNEKKQEEVILSLANHLGVSIKAAKLNQLKFNLFGNEKGPHVSITFRKGKIGSWKEHFKPYHVELFKTHWGSYQQALGYLLE